MPGSASRSVHKPGFYVLAIFVTNLCSPFPRVIPRFSTCPPRLSPALSTAKFHDFSGKTDFLHRSARFSTGCRRFSPHVLWITRIIHSQKLMTGFLFVCHQFVIHPTSVRRILSTIFREAVHILLPGAGFPHKNRSRTPAAPVRRQNTPRNFSSLSIFSACVSPQWMQ